MDLPICGSVFDLTVWVRAFDLFLFLTALTSPLWGVLVFVEWSDWRKRKDLEQAWKALAERMRERR